MNYYKSTSESQKEYIKRNFYLVRLERCVKDLKQFDAMLNSYTCEPQTEALFEQKYDLKAQLSFHKQSSFETINAIQKKKIPLTEQIHQIKSQLRILEKLHADLKEYANTVQNHSKLVVS